MRVCLIIGFGYPVPSPGRHTLPGVMVDMYRIYRLCLSMKPDKIMVITDIDRECNIRDLASSMIKGYVDGGALSFIQSISELGRYTKYIDLAGLERSITGMVEGAHQIFLYYTGHGADGEMVLPIGSVGGSGLRHPMTSIRNSIESNASPKSKSLIVTDCCNSDGVGLPYILRDRVYRRNPRSSGFRTNRTLFICSTRMREDSVTSREGSIFTRLLIEHISRSSDIPKIVSDINSDCRETNLQTATVYSSHPDIKSIWLWTRGLNIDMRSIRKGLVIEIDDNTRK